MTPTTGGCATAHALLSAASAAAQASRTRGVLEGSPAARSPAGRPGSRRLSRWAYTMLLLTPRCYATTAAMRHATAPVRTAPGYTSPTCPPPPLQPRRLTWTPMTRLPTSSSAYGQTHVSSASPPSTSTHRRRRHRRLTRHPCRHGGKPARHAAALRPLAPAAPSAPPSAQYERASMACAGAGMAVSHAPWRLTSLTMASSATSATASPRSSPSTTATATAPAAASRALSAAPGPTAPAPPAGTAKLANTAA